MVGLATTLIVIALFCGVVERFEIGGTLLVAAFLLLR